MSFFFFRRPFAAAAIADATLTYYSMEDYEHGAILVIRATVQWPEGRVVLTVVVADRWTNLGTGPSASRPVWRFWGSRVLRTVRYCTVQVHAKVPKRYVQYASYAVQLLYIVRDSISCEGGYRMILHGGTVPHHTYSPGDATATATDELQEQRRTGDV